MAEGVIDGGQVVDVGVMDRGRPPEPPPDPDRAPHGWTLDRKTKTWRPKKRAGRNRKDNGEHQADDQPAAAAADEGGGWQAERDPEPARMHEDAEPRKPSIVREIPQEIKDDLAAMVGLLGMVVLEPIARADPICGGALVDNWERVTDATIPLLIRSPTIVGWMTTAGGLRDWIGLGIALRPVITAVWSHHVTKTVHLQPPEGEDAQSQIVREDWSVYPAA